MVHTSHLLNPVDMSGRGGNTEKTNKTSECWFTIRTRREWKICKGEKWEGECKDT